MASELLASLGASTISSSPDIPRRIAAVAREELKRLASTSSSSLEHVFEALRNILSVPLPIVQLPHVAEGRAATMSDLPPEIIARIVAEAAPWPRALGLRLVCKSWADALKPSQATALEVGGKEAPRVEALNAFVAEAGYRLTRLAVLSKLRYYTPTLQVATQKCPLLEHVTFFCRHPGADISFVNSLNALTHLSLIADSPFEARLIDSIVLAVNRCTHLGLQVAGNPLTRVTGKENLSAEDSHRISEFHLKPTVKDCVVRAGESACLERLLGAASNLTSLTLQGTLTQQVVEVIASMGRLNSLTWLQAGLTTGGTDAGALEPILGQLALHDIRLEGYEGKWPDEYEDFDALEELELSRCKEIPPLQLLLPTAPNLRSLRLLGPTGPEAGAELLTALREARDEDEGGGLPNGEHGELRHLAVTRCPLPPPCLALVLQTFPQLETLDISGCWSGSGWRELALPLSLEPHPLRRLVALGCNFGEEAAERVARACPGVQVVRDRDPPALELQ